MIPLKTRAGGAIASKSEFSAVPLRPLAAGRLTVAAPSHSGKAIGTIDTPRKATIAAMAVALAGQAAALPLVATAAGTDPWLLAAIFGGAVALASIGIGQLFQRRHGDERAAAADDLALHDALSLALLLGAVPFIGVVGMLLLLPGAVVLSRLMIEATRHRRIAGSHLVYIVIPLIAGLVSCEGAGWQAFAASAAALSVAAAVRAWQRGLSDERRDPPWRKWAVTAFLCAAGAALGMDEGMTLPADGPLLMALAAGLSYGAAAAFGTAFLARPYARLASAAAPFLGLVLAASLGHALSMPQAAAAILLALAIAGSAPLAALAAGKGIAPRDEAGEPVTLWPFWG
ncbi:MAG: hypothetical protein R3D02_10145 [Hyphomicrobiales bacterium]